MFNPAERRDAHGRWTAGPHLSAVLKGHNVKGLGTNPGTSTAPINVKGDVMLAAKLIGQGKHVRLNKVDQVGTLLRDLLVLTQHAKKTNGKFNLCNVSVAKTNLFCAHNKGIDRVNMPQLAGVPHPGSKAAALASRSTANHPGGEVDLTAEFEKTLRAHGIKVTDTTVPAASLKATQDQLVGSKVAGLEKFMETAPKDSPVFEPIFVTRDHYIIDGHHRWAAMVSMDAKDGVLGNFPMKVRVADMEIGEALAAAKAFAQDWGIASEDDSEKSPLVAKFATKSLSSHGVKSIDLAFNPTERRNAKGEWTKGGTSVREALDAIGGNPIPESRSQKEAAAKQEMAKQVALQALNSAVSDYEFNMMFGAEDDGSAVKKLLKAHPELLDDPHGAALLKDHPELSGRPPTYEQSAEDYDWADMDASGMFPADASSVHEEHQAQINALFWHDTLEDSAPEDEHYARSLWELYQNPQEYGSINHTLRTGEQDVEQNGPTAEKMRHYVDVMFDKAGTTTTEPMTLYRAIRSSDEPGHDWAANFKPGSDFKDKGIMSCTAHGKFAQGWLNLDPHGTEVDNEKPNDVVLEIHVPAGTRIVGGHPQFIETMLHPNTPLHIVSNEKRHAKNPMSPLGNTSEDPFDYTHVVAEVVVP